MLQINSFRKNISIPEFSIEKGKKNNAMAENRTRINCLEGSYADHYTTNAYC